MLRPCFTIIVVYFTCLRKLFPNIDSSHALPEDQNAALQLVCMHARDVILRIALFMQTISHQLKICKPAAQSRMLMR